MTDWDDERLARAVLTLVCEPGHLKLSRLISAHGAAATVDALRRSGDESAWAQRAKKADEAALRRNAEAAGLRFLIPGDPEWPARLDDLGNAVEVQGLGGIPVGLWAAGPLRVNEAAARSVAVVGARAATRYGEAVAGDLAAGLAREPNGYVVVSGGAYGIDAAAHRGALAATDGTTIAVLAGGVDRLYPAGNEGLLRRIVQDGAVIAESPPGSVPGRHRFLARNRIIAALTSGTVVVEAGRRSGAISTANHAASLARHLGAVPGPVTSAASAGCHRLLREAQAVCVTSVSEVQELIAPVGYSTAPEPVLGTGLLDGLAEDHARVLDALPARATADVESIARVAGLSPGEVRSALGLLELTGRVRRSGNRWGRVAS